MKNEQIPLTVINPNAAGIDVGSRTHFVAVGQEQKDVKSFGVYAEDLNSLSEWLIENKVTTVAMESTGAYWQNLFVELINSGLEVVLTNGKFTKNINRKKTDVLDCMWIQKMHALGLLPSSFLPDHTTEKLRTLCRHRTNMIQQRADSIHKMAKFLKYLNFRLDVVVRDITGLTGLKIIEDICNGNLDPKSLAAHRHHNCKKSEEEIAKALVSNQREDQNKNALTGVDLNIVSYQYFDGVDLLAIPGVSHATILTIMSEIGLEGFNKFPTAQHFSSWLKLAPNNKISGGRILSNRIPQGSNRLKIALRNAANAVGNLKDSDLAKFFRKIDFKKGRQTAINATARKIAVIIWNMITKKQPYNPTNNYLFLDQKRRIVSRMRKQIADLGLNPDELGFSRANRDKIAKEMPSDFQQLSLR